MDDSSFDVYLISAEKCMHEIARLAKSHDSTFFEHPSNRMEQNLSPATLDKTTQARLDDFGRDLAVAPDIDSLYRRPSTKQVNVSLDDQRDGVP